MNIPEAQKRIEEFNEEHGISDPFPKFDQLDPPAPVEEQPPEEEAEAPVEEEAPAEEAEADDAASVEAPAEDDDIAWVKANKGFDLSDPVVAKTLRNQEEMIRRQGTEVGEARKLREEWESFQTYQAELLAQQQAEQFEPDENWEDWADESLQQDVQGTLEEAMRAGGNPALNYVISRWHLIDPVAATAFQIEFSKPEYHQQAQAPASPQTNDPDAVWARVQARRPDLQDYNAAMTTLYEENAEIREQMDKLVSEGRKDEALDRLYLEASKWQTDKQRSDALAKANAARVAQADASARDATVASATASAGHGEGRPLTEAEQVRANIRAELGLVVPD